MCIRDSFPRSADELPRAIGEDGAGNIWIGLNDGAARYRNDAFALFKTANGLPLGRIVDIRTDSGGVCGWPPRTRD